MKKLIQIFTVLILSSIIVHSQIQQQWVKIFYASGSRGLFVNTDPAGNVYTVGSMTGMDAPVITFLQAFNSNGAELWDTVLYNTPCSPIGVNFDSQYNQYIAGYYPGGWGPANFSVYKYNTAGLRIWSLIEPITFNDKMNAMTGDKAGNSFIVKYKNGEHLLQKLNSSGAQQFLVTITDTLDPQSIALDPQGNIIIWGFASTGSALTGVSIKFNPSGAKIWKRIFIPEGNGLTASNSMKAAAALSGNIYLLCTTRDTVNHNRYTLLKYDPDGNNQRVSYYSFFNNTGSTTSMCIENYATNMENAIVTGTSGTVKFNSSGNPVWFDTAKSFYDIKADKNYNYYLTGSSSSYPFDFRTIKLSNSGVKLWDIAYNGTYNYNDGAYSLTVDNSGNVYVTGYSNSVPIMGSTFCTTIKYSQAEIDSASLNFLPLALGNVWVYKHYTNTPPSSNFDYKGKVKYEIIKDTLMSNGMRYYDRTYLGYTRIAPVSLGVFSYFQGSEVKKDSLRAKLQDTVVTCYYVTDTTHKNVLGSERRNKFVNTYCMITNHQYFWNLTYRLGYWTYSNITDGTIEGFTDTLVGAVINGIVYGDTTIDALQKLSNYVPMDFSISQNYPNPFNPSTKIKFAIPSLRGARGMITLTIYDVLGREITALVNEQLSPGTYEVEWDGSNYPSGVYFYKLIINDASTPLSITKKMVLIK